MFFAAFGTETNHSPPTRRRHGNGVQPDAINKANRKRPPPLTSFFWVSRSARRWRSRSHNSRSIVRTRDFDSKAKVRVGNLFFLFFFSFRSTRSAHRVCCRTREATARPGVFIYRNLCVYLRGINVTTHSLNHLGCRSNRWLSSILFRKYAFSFSVGSHRFLVGVV